VDEEKAKEQGEKTFSLLLLKEKGAVVGEGTPIRERQNDGQKTLSLPPFNVDGI